MKISKFFTLVKCLSRNELKGFEYFLHEYLTYHKRGGHEILKVYHYVIAGWPAFSDAGFIDPSHVSRQVFNKDLRKVVQNAYSDLYLKLKDYLIGRKILSTAFEKEHIWLKVLEERGLFEDYLKIAEAFCDRFDEPVTNARSTGPKKQALATTGRKYPRPNVEQGEFETALQSGVEHYRNCVTSNELRYQVVEPAKKQSNLNSLSQYNRNLDRYYYLSKIKLGCEMILLNKAHPVFDTHFLDDMVAQIEEGWLIHDPLIGIYVKLYYLIKVGDPEKQSALFFDAYTSLKNHIHSIAPEELQRIATILINYCGYRNNSGDSDYIQYVYEIAKLTSEAGAFARFNVLTPLQFNNFISSACKFGDYDWAQQLIEQQSPFFPPGIAISTCQLAKYSILFAQGRYEEVIDYLHNNENEFNDPLHKLRAKSLIIRSHYIINKNNFDILSSQLNAFSAFLRRNLKKDKNNYRPYANFISVLNMMMHGKEKKKIQKFISRKQTLALSEWLNEQLAHYK